MEEVKYKVLKEIDGFEIGDIVSENDFQSTEVENYLVEGRLELINSDPIPYDGPMGQYKITGEAEYTDEEGEPTGFLEVGSIQTLPVPVGDQFVEDGVAEKIAEAPASEIKEKDEDEGAGLAPAPVSTPKVFEGKEIVSDVTREVNGKVYHHIRLLDGTAQDLTDEDYEVKVIQANA